MPSPNHSAETGLVRSDAFAKSLLDCSITSLATKGLVHRSFGSSGGRHSQTHAVELLVAWSGSSHIETYQTTCHLSTRPDY